MAARASAGLDEDRWNRLLLLSFRVVVVMARPVEPERCRRAACSCFASRRLRVSECCC